MRNTLRIMLAATATAALLAVAPGSAQARHPLPEDCQDVADILSTVQVHWSDCDGPESP